MTWPAGFCQVRRQDAKLVLSLLWLKMTAGWPLMSRDCAVNSLAVLDRGVIEAASVIPVPYLHILASRVVRKEVEEDLLADAPQINRAGSFAISDLSFGAHFSGLIDDLMSDEFRCLVEDKFQIQLGAFPRVLTVRGYSSRRADGHVHPDLKDKVITVLLYLNREWPHRGGRLRVLRSRDLEDCAFEVPPEIGNMLIFRPCTNSWHGHLPYEGPRLAVQMNWVRSQGALMREYWHRKMHALFGANFGRHRSSRPKPGTG
jgi:SM-20-related protein